MSASLAIERTANADEVWQPLSSGMNQGVSALIEYNGELIAGGGFSSAGGRGASKVARWNGTSWHAMGGGMNGDVAAFALYDGELVAGGYFTTAGGEAANGIALWTGGNWQSLGEGVNSIVWAVTEYNGDLIAGGLFTLAGGQPANYIARWDGTLWHSLGTGMNERVNALTVYNGELIAAGRFTVAGGQQANHVARWNGSTWQPLGSGVTSGGLGVNTLTSYNGELVVGGRFHLAGGQPANDIARWNGSAWQSLGDGVDSWSSGVTSLGVHNGTLVVGGDNMIGAGGYVVNNIARWNGSDWQAPLGTGMNNSVFALSVFNGSLVAGGLFTTAGGQIVNHVAKSDANPTTGCELWQPLSSGMDGPVLCLNTYRNELIAGGSFSTAGGQSANRIASWNGSAWQPLGSGMNEAGVYALEVFNDDLVAGGDFTLAGGQFANRIARWNGSLWQPMGNGMNGSVRALSVYNGELIAAGEFTTAGAQTANYIARWNGFEWQPLGDGIGASWSGVWALGVYNGELVAGGTFMFAGDQAANYIARWNGTIWRPLGNGMDHWQSPAVGALTVFNGELIAGGSFSHAGGQPANYIARWDGSVWQPLGAGLNYSVLDLNVYDGELIACGVFWLAGGQPANRIARWNGSQWRSFGQGGVNQQIHALEVYNSQGIVGGFLTTGGSFIARWGPNSWLQPNPATFDDNNAWEYGFAQDAPTSFGTLPGMTPFAVSFRAMAHSSSLCITNQSPVFNVNGNDYDITNHSTIGSAETAHLTVNNGTVVSPSVDVGSFGTLGGDGQIIGNVFNVGTVQPGGSPSNPGTLTVSGNYEQPFGIFNPLIGPSAAQHGQLDVSLNASLAGTLKVDLVGSPQFKLGQEFPVLTCGTLNGTFGTAVLPFVGDNLVLNVQYNHGGEPVSEGGSDGKSTSNGGVAGGGQGVVIVVGQPGGSPDFGTPTEMLIEGEPTGVTGADVNPLIEARDLALSMKSIPSGSPGNAVILLNQGDGTSFQLPIIEPVGIDPSGIVCAALANGEAEDDFAISNFGSDSVSVLFHDGGGAFTRLDVLVGDGPSAITAGDLNGDAFIDLAVTNQLDHTVTVLLNNGDRTFSNAPGSPIAVGNSPVAISAAELNSLPGNDLVVAAMGFGGVWIIPGIGGGGFGGPTIIPTGITPTSVTPGDIENDKDFDLIVGNSGGGSLSLIVNSGGSFAPPVDLPVDGNPVPGAVTSWDMDADDDLDLVAIVDDETLGRVIRILRNDTPEGSNQIAFTMMPAEGVGENPRLIRGSDVTGDLAEDLVTVNVVQSALAGSVPNSLTIRPNISVLMHGDATGDGLVNIDDILSLVQFWGPCPALPAECDGDVFPFPNGNGTVDIDDLLLVIGNWSPAK